MVRLYYFLQVLLVMVVSVATFSLWQDTNTLQRSPAGGRTERPNLDEFLDLAESVNRINDDCPFCLSFHEGREEFRPENSDEENKCVAKANAKFALRMNETIVQKLEELNDQEKQLEQLKSTDGLDYQTWLKDDIQERQKAYIALSRRLSSIAATMIQNFRSSIFLGAEERHTVPIYTNLEQLMTAPLNDRPIDTRKFSKMLKFTNSKMLDKPLKFEVSSQQNAQELPLDTLYDFITQNEPVKSYAMGPPLIDSNAANFSQSNFDNNIFNRPEMVDVAIQNADQIKQWIRTDPNFKAEWDRQIKRARQSLWETDTNNDFLKHPKLASALLDEINHYIHDDSIHSNPLRICQYERNLYDALKENEERVIFLYTGLVKEMRKPCSKNELTPEEARHIKENLNDYHDSLLYTRSGKRKRWVPSSNPGLCEKLNWDELGGIKSATITDVKERLRHKRNEYSQVQKRYNSNAGEPDTGFVSTGEIFSLLSPEERALFKQEDSTDLSFLFSDTPEDQGERFSCLAHAVTHELEKAYVKDGKIVESKELSAADAYGILLATDLSRPGRRKRVNLGAEDIRLELFKALRNRPRYEINMSIREFAALSDERKDLVLTDATNKLGLSSYSFNALSEYEFPLERENDSAKARFHKSLAQYSGGRAAEYANRVSSSSYENIDRLVASGQTLVAFTNSSARRYFGDWIQYAESDGIGHAFLIIGQGKHIDPTDGIEKPAFKVRDSNCESSEKTCIDQYVSAEQLMPHIQALYQFSE